MKLCFNILLLLLIVLFNINSDENKRLKVQSEPDYPPFCIKDASGNSTGFSVELFKAAAEIMGYDVDIEIGPWNIIKENLAKGDIDALPLVGRSPERELLYDFTVPYHTLNGAIFVSKDSKTITSLEDLDNAAILVMKGDNADEYISRTYKNANIIRTVNFASAFRQLSTGEADAVVAQKLMGQELLKNLNINNIKVLDLPIDGFSQDFSFAVKKGNAELLADLNEGLVLLFSNGTFEDLYKKWFFQTLPEMSYQEVMKVILPVLIPIIFVLFIVAIIFMNIRVKARTKSLNIEITERMTAEKEITRQLTEKNILLKEVHHRIKNNFSSIEAFINLSSLNQVSSEAKKALNSAAMRVGSMRILYEKLLIDDEYKKMPLKDYISPLVDEIISFYGEEKNVKVNLTVDDIVLDTKLLFHYGIILTELLTNSIKYAFPNNRQGKIDIKMFKENNLLKIFVIDDGIGKEEKTPDSKKGFGTTIVRMLCKQLNGTYNISNNNGFENIIEIPVQ